MSTALAFLSVHPVRDWHGWMLVIVNLVIGFQLGRVFPRLSSETAEPSTPKETT